MNIRERIRKHTHWKQNPIEKALQAPDTAARAATQIANLREMQAFLKSKYGITDIKPITAIICNMFMTGIDSQKRKLFIKTGNHAGIYENEYIMGKRLYEIDCEHFLKPLYYNDYDKFKFFANEYTTGITLKTAIMTETLSDNDKSHIIGDIWRIFCALRDSDVVHRDIRPDNMMLVDGRLVLIDFQLAVSKTNYVELEYLARRANRLRKLGNKKYRYRPFVWDDAYSLLKVMEFIGREKRYGLRYDIIYKHIRQYIGRDKIKSSVRENDLRRIVRHIRTLRI